MTTDELKNLRQVSNLADELEASEALYGAALDGMSASIERDIRELEEYDLDGKMAVAEGEVAGMIADGLEADASEMEAFEQELTDDDADEETALRDDEADPLEQGKKLQDAGETE